MQNQNKSQDNPEGAETGSEAEAGKLETTGVILLAALRYPPTAIILLAFLAAVSSLLLDIGSLIFTGETVTPIWSGKLLRVLGLMVQKF